MNYGKDFMTMDQVRKDAPSVFTESPSESVSSRYKFASTSQVLETLDDNGWRPVQARQRGSRKEATDGFQQHMIRCRHQTVSKVERGDVIPEIVVTNSHNGSTSFQIKAGMFRLVCSNGLVVADSTLNPLRLIHTKFDSDQVSEIASHMIDQIPIVLNRIDEMKAKTLTGDPYGEFAHEVMKIRCGNDETAWPAIGPTAFLGINRKEDHKDDLWTVFNRAQENVVRGGIRYIVTDKEGTQRRAKLRGITSVFSLMQANLKLWELADKTLVS